MDNDSNIISSGANGNVSFDLLIIFRDTSRKVIKNVTGYGYCFDGGHISYYYSKNGYRSFMPEDAISFIGRNVDYLS